MTVVSEALQDVKFFREKLAATTDADAQEKLKRQIALLEDAIVVYHLTTPERGPALWFVPDEVIGGSLGGGTGC